MDKTRKKILGYGAGIIGSIILSIFARSGLASSFYIIVAIVLSYQLYSSVENDKAAETRIPQQQSRSNRR